MKLDVPRARFRVKPVDKDLVESEIGHEREPVGRVDDDRMRARLRLPLRVHPVARVLIKRRPITQRAVGVERKHGQISPVIVCRKHEASCPVETDIACIPSPREFPVEKNQPSAVWLNRVCSYATRGSGIARVEMAAVGSDDKECWS